MREAIFRGRRIDNSEWICGSLIIFWDKIFIAPQSTNAFYKFEVFPDTVGQYTGRLDKFGEMVYEGDILQTYIYGPDDFVDMGETCVVLFDVHDQAYVLCNSNDVHDRYDDFGNLGDPKYYQVIGNIYDNPELLKGETNE